MNVMGASTHVKPSRVNVMGASTYVKPSRVNVMDASTHVKPSRVNVMGASTYVKPCWVNVMGASTYVYLVGLSCAFYLLLVALTAFTELCQVSNFLFGLNQKETKSSRLFVFLFS